MPKITIAAIIPLYNGAPFIRQALESILSQTRLPDEIIVVDDGSTDDGPAIVREIAERHPVTLLSKAKGGQSSARNHAIDLCRSSHIAPLDQDDSWYPKHLEILRAPFEEPDAPGRLALVYGNLDHIDVHGKMVAHNCLDVFGGIHPKTTLQECLCRDMFILPGATLFNRDAFLRVGQFDERLSGFEDDDLFLRFFRDGYRSVYIDEPVSQWRIHAGSTSYSIRMSISRMIYYRKLVELFPNEPKLHQHWVRDIIAPRFFRAAVGDFIVGSRTGDAVRVERMWSDLREIGPELPRRSRRRLRRVTPLINLTYRGRFRNIARLLLRYAVSRRK